MTSGPARTTAARWLAAHAWDFALVAVWLVVATPVVLAGTLDIEEYYTGVASTLVGVRALADGALPFWNIDMGLGLPQPLRFHFLTHPFAAFCVAGDCSLALRALAAVHVLAGAIFMSLLVRRLTDHVALGAVAGMTFCLSASVVQTLITDDWPFTAAGDAALPVFVYAGLALPVAGNVRRTWLWTLVLGGLAGLFLSMWFPFRTLLVFAITILFAPGLRARWPWLVAAGVLALAIGAGHIYHLYEQFLLTPPGVIRIDHEDQPLAFHLWSAFARPFPLGSGGQGWRSTFIGPLFAVAALLAAVLCRGPAIRVFRVGLLVSVVCWLLPEWMLFDLVTNRWAFRIGVEVFAIVLAAYGLHRWWMRSPRALTWAVGAIVAVHLGWMALAVYPVWSDVARIAFGDAPYSDARYIQRPGVSAEFVARQSERPGRVAFSPDAERPLRDFTIAGLGTNQLAMHGVPALSARASGITGDALIPSAATFITQMRLTPQAVESAAFLDVLGIRYLVATAGERVAADLVTLRDLGSSLVLYENTDAWPEAFAVAAFPEGPIPRLAGCGHDRFLCADLARAHLQRTGEPIAIARLHDGLRLELPPDTRPRLIVMSQWYREGWTVTEGRASVGPAVEQLVGVRVEPGETRVAVRFRPAVRMAFFTAGVVVEAAAVMAALVLLVRERRGTTQSPVVDSAPFTRRHA
jgi:hypothetical protein